MAAVVFPTSLPQPSLITMKPRDRLLRSSVLEGLPQVRNIQREFVANETLQWTLSIADYAIWMDCWKNTLLFGQRWFSAAWQQVDEQVVTARFLGGSEGLKVRYLGNDYVEISIGTEIRRSPPPFTPRIEADLYLKFDEDDATEWRDYSIHNRTISVLPRSTGTIAGVAGGAFGRGGRFTQAYPGSRLDTHYHDHSCLTASGNIAQDGADWVAHVVVNRSVLDIGFGMTLLTTGTAGAEGIFIHLYRNEAEGWIDVICSVVLNPLSPEVQEIRIIDVGGFSSGGDAGANHLYTFSKHGQLFTSLRDGVIAQQNLTFEPTDVIVTPTRGFTRIAAGSIGETPTPSLIDSFDGVLDELYLAHGPGTGISANFSMPTEPHG